MPQGIQVQLLPTAPDLKKSLIAGSFLFRRDFKRIFCKKGSRLFPLLPFSSLFEIFAVSLKKRRYYKSNSEENTKLYTKKNKSNTLING
jgi:hypothetical protein